MDKKKNVIFASHPDYSGNTKALYEYMKRYSKNLNLCWVAYDKSNYELMKNAKIDVVLYDTEEFNKVFDTTDVVIFDHDELMEIKKDNQKFIYLSHGLSCKKFGYILDSGNLASGDEKYLELMKNNIDYIIASSEFCKLIFKLAYDFESDRILPLGFPRVDYIYTKNAKKNLEIVLGKKVDSFSKIIIYLPTFRDGLGRESDGKFTRNIFNIDEYDESELDAYLKKNNYLLVIKYHPYEKNKKKNYESDNIVYMDDDVMTKNMLSLTEIISSVDLVVADYSSAHSELLILDKPVCFLKNDIEIYKKNRGIIIDDTNMWFPGPFVKNIDDLKKELKKLISDKNYYSAERKNYVEMIFGKNVKNNSKRVYEYLFGKGSDLLNKKSKMVDNEKIELYNENIKLHNENTNLKSELNHLKNTSSELKKQNDDLSIKLADCYNTLDLIYNSKGWKILEKIRKIKK